MSEDNNGISVKGSESIKEIRITILEILGAKANHFQKMKALETFAKVALLSNIVISNNYISNIPKKEGMPS